MIKSPIYFLKTLDRPTLRFILACFFLSLLVHIITAVFSIGFHHWDEHYQLLEFAGLKLGKTTPVELPWEYAARIRPALQPYIALYVIKLFNIEGPFTAVFILRQISGLLGWFSISLFSICVVQWIKSPRLQKLLILLTAILWFLPYVHVRFSSESWSGSFFFLGLSALFISQAEFRRASQFRELFLLCIAGLCFGLSFVFRMQSILLIPGVFLWYLIIGRMKFYKLFLMGMAMLAAIAFGVLMDYYFYGQWVNTAFRYFQINILEGKAATFGVDPWWYYFKESYKKGLVPIGLIMIAGVLVAWIRFPKNILTWATVPFFILHCFVGHKELRFLFPMVNAVPVLMIMSVNNLKLQFLKTMPTYLQKTGKWIVAIFLMYNFVAMLNVSVMPVHPEFKVLQYFNKNYFNKEISIIGYGEDPYENFAQLRLNFYKSPKYHIYKTEDLNMINYIVDKADHPVFLYRFDKGFAPPPVLDSIHTKWKPEYYTLSPVLQKFNFNNWASRTTIGIIYYLNPELTHSKINHPAEKKLSSSSK